MEEIRSKCGFRGIRGDWEDWREECRQQLGAVKEELMKLSKQGRGSFKALMQRIFSLSSTFSTGGVD